MVQVGHAVDYARARHVLANELKVTRGNRRPVQVDDVEASSLPAQHVFYGGVSRKPEADHARSGQGGIVPLQVIGRHYAHAIAKSLQRPHMRQHRLRTGVTTGLR